MAGRHEGKSIKGKNEAGDGMFDGNEGNGLKINLVDFAMSNNFIVSPISQFTRRNKKLRTR